MEELFKLVPPAVAGVIITVWLMNRSHSNLTKDLSERATKCHEECTEVVKENRTAVNENTKVLTRLSTLLETRIKQTNGD